MTAFGTDVAKTLALPLLWAAFDDHRVDITNLEDPQAPHLEAILKESILEMYVEEYGVLREGWENPVERVGLLPQGHGAQLNMLELRRDEDVATGEDRDLPAVQG